MAGKKLTLESIEARMEMYDEAITHLEALDPCELTTEEEVNQAKIVIRQLRTLADKWYLKIMKGVE